MPDVVVTIKIGASYPAELKERLARLSISHGELSRESGIGPTQISRMFNKDMVPTLANIERIEAAVERIRQRRGKEKPAPKPAAKAAKPAAPKPAAKTAAKAAPKTAAKATSSKPKPRK